MNNNHVKGKFNELKGQVKEEVGHAVGDNSKTISGVADQIKGKVQQGFGELKDAIKRGVDSVLNRDDKKQAS